MIGSSRLEPARCGPPEADRGALAAACFRYTAMQRRGYNCGSLVAASLCLPRRSEAKAGRGALTSLLALKRRHSAVATRIDLGLRN